MNQTQAKGNRNLRLIIAVIVLIPILIIAWWLASPLWISKTVDESFPLSASAVIPTGVTQSEAEQVMMIMNKLGQDMSEPMPSSASPEALLSGSFRDGDSFHKGSGQAIIYRLEDGSHVLRLEDINITNGPDLRVLLVNHADPQTRADVHDSGFVELGKLKGNMGSQNYEIPADVDLATVKSIVIYCKPFQVVFSVAALS
jgi:hypothetical protein